MKKMKERGVVVVLVGMLVVVYEVLIPFISPAL